LSNQKLAADRPEIELAVLRLANVLLFALTFVVSYRMQRATNGPP